ncbi:Cofilin/actin-depolymerizing factor [Amphibalanus amphitrite]|uniref:Cofilin/actin-depolymerizing factor n=1 Tax=Amphibalanus amphitrite TaxID=1232801 RepID=A0A6A4WH08_AMPAM|nr:Cofilin/actin-depolymerizing factor [Amphibalanus amphitrite]
MEASGVSVSDACKTVFDEVKKAKKHRYVVFVIKDDVMIDVEAIGDRDATYEDFVTDIQKAGKGMCRYGLFDYEYLHAVQGAAEPTKKQKLFLMLWCPDEAKIKAKMLYSSSFDALKKALTGVAKYVEATDSSEISKEEVENKLRQNDRM